MNNAPKKYNFGDEILLKDYEDWLPEDEWSNLDWLEDEYNFLLEEDSYDTD